MKRFISFLVIMFLFVFLSACSTSNEQYDSKLQKLEERVLNLEFALDDLNKKVESTASNNTNSKEIPTSLNTPAPTNINDNSDKSEYTLGAGNYFVGDDISSGRYDIVWISGSGYCSVYKEEGHSTDTMSMCEKGKYESYIQEYKNCILVNGGKIEVSSGLTVKFLKK